MNGQPVNTPRTVSEAWPSRWLKGRPWVLTIKAVKWEELHAPGGTITKPTVLFNEAKKALILNKTQAQQIAHVVGSEDFDDWPGHTIQVRPGRAPNNKPTIVIGYPPVPQRIEEDARA
jgi:hypothetical protein